MTWTLAPEAEGRGSPSKIGCPALCRGPSAHADSLSARLTVAPVHRSGADTLVTLQIRLKKFTDPLDPTDFLLNP